MTKESLLAQNAFQRLVNEIGQSLDLQTNLQMKDSENESLSKQLATAGEIIAHVKETCAYHTELMEWIEGKLKDEAPVVGP